MLPEVLSNEAMSLAPGRPKRVISVSALLGPDGALRGVRLDEGVIVSAARLTYEQVQDLLDKQLSLDPRLDAALAEADRLAQILRGRRLARGAFDLCVPEAEVQLGERGEPLAIRRRQSDGAIRSSKSS